MSYRTNRQITMIDDLPFLDDIENSKTNGLTMIPTDNTTTVQKFIRNNNYNPPVESGMSNQTSSSMQQQQQQQMQQQIQQMQQIQQQQQQETFENEMFDDPRIYMSRFQEPQEQARSYHSSRSHSHEPSCITVAEHTTNCIVCSKLYQNNMTGYIIVIIILAIISILLLKRVLNV